MAAAAGFGLEAFDASNPQAYYLGQQQAELEPLADAALIVEATRLPVHSQVLALASPVLCGAFAGARGPSEQAGTSCGQKRKREEGGELVLEAPFQGFSMHDVALILRLVYNQEWLADVPAMLGTLHRSLPSLLRLAHCLDAAGLLGTLTKYMAGPSCASLSSLAAWLEAAEACQLDKLRLSLVHQAAHSLVSLHDGELADTVAEAGALAQCEPRTLVQLVSAVTAAGYAASNSNSAGLISSIPSVADLEKAAAAAAPTESFEWKLQRFSQRAARPGQYVISPWFSAAGHQWMVVVYPADQQVADRLAVYLKCKTDGLKALYKVAVLDGTGAACETGVAQNTFTKADSYGLHDLCPIGTLHDRGLLPGDCLHLRVTVVLLAS